MRLYGICGVSSNRKSLIVVVHGVGNNRKSLIVVVHGVKILLGKVAFAPALVSSASVMAGKCTYWEQAKKNR